MGTRNRAGPPDSGTEGQARRTTVAGGRGLPWAAASSARANSALKHTRTPRERCLLAPCNPEELGLPHLGKRTSCPWTWVTHEIQPADTGPLVHVPED